jgi:hypothetical protein
VRRGLRGRKLDPLASLIDLLISRPKPRVNPRRVRLRAGALFEPNLGRCPCESADERPGPHLPRCPFNDPNYGLPF